ncbi:MAG: glycosyltransferase, partial [Clostridia bacterium]|nr:glycosyltransferase [Clostridia bacterium]
MNTINVCFITDNGYCKPTATAIASLINNKSKNDLLEIYIICDGVSEENKNKLLKLSKDTNKIHIVEAAGLEQYKNMFENPNISATTAALYKFLIPNFLANLDKVVYLDGDVLVLHSLS